METIAPSCTFDDPTGLKNRADQATASAGAAADKLAAKVDATLNVTQGSDAIAPFVPTIEQMGEIMPVAKAEGRLAEWHLALVEAMIRDQINTPLRVAPFLANVAEETGELKARVENLNYSAEQMRRTWGAQFFPGDTAERLAYKPEELANYIYNDAIRPRGYKLGNVDAGDGWKYRGRGPHQLTGRNAYEMFFEAIGLPRRTDPDELLKPSLGSRAATWHWKFKGCNALADAGNFDEIVLRLNGGRINYDQRVAYFNRAKRAFGLLL